MKQGGFRHYARTAVGKYYNACISLSIDFRLHRELLSDCKTQLRGNAEQLIVRVGECRLVVSCPLTQFLASVSIYSASLVPERNNSGQHAS